MSWLGHHQSRPRARRPLLAQGQLNPATPKPRRTARYGHLVWPVETNLLLIKKIFFYNFYNLFYFLSNNILKKSYFCTFLIINPNFPTVYQYEKCLPLGKRILYKMPHDHLQVFLYKGRSFWHFRPNKYWL